MIFIFKYIRSIEKTFFFKPKNFQRKQIKIIRRLTVDKFLDEGIYKYI